MASAWVRAPERFNNDLHKHMDGDAERQTPDPNATFSPQLVSNPDLREKVRSSSYGVVLPKVEKVELEDNDLRPWQEQPTFAPQLPECELRSKAQSSKYGTTVANPPERPAPQSPSFTPELVTKHSKVSQQWQGKSAGYGRVAAAPSPKKEPPRPSFTPEFPPNKLREKINNNVTSSHYGKASPARVERPKSAPVARGRSTDFLPPRNIHEHDGVFAERAKGGSFVLDCVAVAGALSRIQKYPGIKPKEGISVTPEVVQSPRSRELVASARSSQYGLKSPARGDRPAPRTPEKRLSFSAGTWERDLPPTPRSALNAQVRSHSYGKETPAVVQRPPRPASEPRFSFGRSTSAPELDPVPRSKLNDKVRSHQYGTASPEKAPRPHVSMSPVWVPSSGKGQIPNPEPTPRRSKAYDGIRGHYGSDYTPPSPYYSDSIPHAAY